MRFEGVLSAWNHEAGYGSIRPSRGGDEVFVSLAAFPTDGEGPRLDEPLSFEIVSGRDGRKQAVKLFRLPASALSPALRGAASARSRSRVLQQKKRRLGLAAGAVATVMVVLGGLYFVQPGRDAGATPAAFRR